MKKIISILIILILILTSAINIAFASDRKSLDLDSLILINIIDYSEDKIKESTIKYYIEEYTTEEQFFIYEKTSESNIMIIGCISNDDIISIPDCIDGYIVTSIEPGWLNAISPRGIIIPETIEGVAAGTFACKNNLLIIIFENENIEIAEDAFIGCDNIKLIYSSAKNISNNYIKEAGSYISLMKFNVDSIK